MPTSTQTDDNERWRAIAMKCTYVVVAERSVHKHDVGKSGIVFWSNASSGTVGFDMTGRRNERGLRADVVFVNFRDLDIREHDCRPRLVTSSGAEPVPTWEAIFEASDLVIPVGCMFESFDAYGTTWTLTRTAHDHEGEVNAWHYTSTDGRRITILND